ncbi:MAG TPA: hypothetical protein VJ715_17730 [Pyrinomonadaceae bacterium]|nr:hypothetical protein [Pyrinomonadaceae bacterium]
MSSEAINLGPRERRKRRLMGIVALTVGVGLAFVMVVYGAPRLYRLVIFFPIWMAGLGLLQSREKTCIALAARGVCNMDDGEEKIADERRVEELRDKARWINRRALLTAAAITLLALVFPTQGLG